MKTKVKYGLTIIAFAVMIVILQYSRVSTDGKKHTAHSYFTMVTRQHVNTAGWTHFSPYNKRMFNWKTSSKLDNWRFSEKIDCPAFSVNTPKQSRREKIVIKCDHEVPRIVSQWTNSSNDIFRIPFGDPCLISTIEKNCRGGKPVPNVMHYVWYKDRELDFFPFLSMMSVLRFMKPCLILLHGNHTPYGKYWDYFVSLSPNIINVVRERPTHIFGQKLAFMEHAADVMRIEALNTYGGIYIDYDTLFLRSPEPLRKYDVTMGKAFPTFLSPNFIMGKRNASFLTRWYLTYRDDYLPTWSYNSGTLPFRIYKTYPESIHIDGYNFTRPHGGQVDLIFNKNYDWSTNYAMHMYIRYYKSKVDTDIIRTLNTTVGAVARHILLGNKELCRK